MRRRRQFHPIIEATLFFLPLVALLAVFHFWGEWQRKREWWWAGGDVAGMTFVDVSQTRTSEATRRGHILMVSMRTEPDGSDATELNVTWDCERRLFSAGRMRLFTADGDEFESREAPQEMSAPHAAQENSAFAAALNIACGTDVDRARMRTVRAERNPIEATRLALALVNEGVDRLPALFLAVGDPKSDPVGYERMLVRHVPPAKANAVRRMTGAAAN